ncbi:MAG: segregation/condensation protein A [Candidatus Aenigmarchaeota archaeon]|nr:segregation/condensation protein A [Candidatus Aenigmarchaeota archaeon]
MEQKLMGMITSSSSWEQVIYEVIAWEGLDPWDIDIKKLAGGFVKYLNKMETMDFKIPAKYVMIASTLLRMKSDHLPLLDYFNPEDGEVEQPIGAGEVDPENLELNLLTIPPRRLPTRRIVVTELVAALQKALRTSHRRALRTEEAIKSIKLKEDEIGKRISVLYDRINLILRRAKKEEVTFSSLVPTWERKEVAHTFVPLVFLDHDKKVSCRQEEMFEEIYVRRGESPVEPAPVKEAKTRGPQKRH